jgi:hypothetical protein
MKKTKKEYSQSDSARMLTKLFIELINRGFQQQQKGVFY